MTTQPPEGKKFVIYLSDILELEKKMRDDYWKEESERILRHHEIIKKCNELIYEK